ncbi:hypothetical protein Tanf_10445, partial [Tannerella forsythia]
NQELCGKIESVDDTVYLSRTDDSQASFPESVFLKINIQTALPILYEAEEIIIIGMGESISF